MLEESIQKLQELRKHEDVGIAYVELAKVQFSIGEMDSSKSLARSQEVYCRYFTCTKLGETKF